MLRDLRREQVADVGADELLRRHGQGRRVIGLHVEIGAVAADAEHEVRDRVEKRAVPHLHPLQRLERAFVRERETGGRADGVEELGALPQRPVVDEHSDLLALMLDRRRDARLAGCREEQAALRCRRGSCRRLPCARARATDLRARAGAHPRDRAPPSRRRARRAARRRRPARGAPAAGRRGRLPGSRATRACRARCRSPRGPTRAARGRARPRRRACAILPPISTGCKCRRAAGVAACARRVSTTTTASAIATAIMASSSSSAVESAPFDIDERGVPGMSAVPACERIEQDGESPARRGRRRTRRRRACGWCASRAVPSGTRAERARSPRRRGSQ